MSKKKVFTVMPGRHNYRPTAGDRVPAIDVSHFKLFVIVYLYFFTSP